MSDNQSNLTDKEMEDRYLFKAKFDDSDRWVKGQLVEVNDTYLIIPNHARKILSGLFSTSNVVEVKKDTICQCTGLKDKNGNLIWENDIMVAHLDKDNPEDITYAIVAWRENGWVTVENGSDDLNQIDDFTTENFEVVSTRFDNTELLEV